MRCKKLVLYYVTNRWTRLYSLERCPSPLGVLEDDTVPSVSSRAACNLGRDARVWFRAGLVQAVRVNRLTGASDPIENAAAVSSVAWVLKPGPSLTTE